MTSSHFLYAFSKPLDLIVFLPCNQVELRELDRDDLAVYQPKSRQHQSALDELTRNLNFVKTSVEKEVINLLMECASTHQPTHVLTCLLACSLARLLARSLKSAGAHWGRCRQERKICRD
jgi:hypothetical protein